MSYRSILYKNELKILEGKNKRNILILSLILVLMMIGLGTSVGGLKALNKRMNNPYTKWVNLPINPSDYTTSKKFQDNFEEDSIKRVYNIENIRGYKRDYVKIGFFNDTNNFQYKTSRTVESDEPLLQEVLKSSNLHTSINTAVMDDTDCWIIVKKEMLEDIGYDGSPDDFKFINLRITYIADHYDINLYIPVIAVVDELPDKADLLIPDHLSELTKTGQLDNLINFRSNNTIELLSEQELQTESLEVIPPLDTIGIYDIEYEALSNGNKDLIINHIYLDEDIDFKSKIKIIKTLKDKLSVIEYNDFSCEIGSTLYLQDAQYLAINFIDLSNVRKFAADLKKDYGLEVSLNQVENKENFSLVSTLTMSLSIMLFLVSLIGVLLYIINLVVNHINTIRSNLGTLKAFGLSNKLLISDYRNIMLLFLTKALGLSIILALIYSLFCYMLEWDFTLWHWSIIVSVLLIYIILMISLKSILNKHLNKSPGDLIYNRN